MWPIAGFLYPADAVDNVRDEADLPCKGTWMLAAIIGPVRKGWGVWGVPSDGGTVCRKALGVWLVP